MVRWWFLFPVLLLSACATERVIVETKEVKVPALYCPAPPEVQKPQLAVQTIGPDDDIGTVAVKYAATVRALSDYAKQLERVVDLYRKKDGKIRVTKDD